MSLLKRAIKYGLNAAGLELRKITPTTGPRIRMPVELSMEEQEIVSYVVGKRLTMTSYERLWATLMACKHVISANIEGDFVECGVWRGGHALLAAAIFKLHKCERNLFLFDTFEGMTKPTDRDRQFEDNGFAMEQYQGHDAGADNAWCYSSLQDVTWISELNRRS